MFENPSRGMQANNVTTNVPKILVLKSSSEQIFYENCRWVPLSEVVTKQQQQQQQKVIIRLKLRLKTDGFNSSIFSYFRNCKTNTITLNRYFP